MMQYLCAQLEALIFASHAPISLDELHICLNEYLAMEIPRSDIEQALAQLQQKYAQADTAIGLYVLAGGYQLLTKPEHHKLLSIWLKQTAKKQLSKAALETLAIIAYKQPITKSEIEQIRGVNSDYAVQKLLDRELLRIAGKADTPGRPVLYATSDKFMEYFGINTLEELPQPKDFGEAGE